MKLKVPIQGAFASTLRHRQDKIATAADIHDPLLPSAAEVGVDTIAVELFQVVAG